MLVVIDESGCTGFKQGSSSHFVIAMIIFDSFNDAEQTANVIHKLKRDLGMQREFKFSASKDSRRDAFFEAIKSCRFSVRFFVVEKKRIHSDFLQDNGDKFINYCLRNLIQSGMHRLVNAVVKIDGKSSKRFKRECASYLRRHVGSNVIRKVTFCDSQSDVLIQLADMMVSAYSRPFNNPDKQNAFRWRNMMERKIENVWNFR